MTFGKVAAAFALIKGLEMGAMLITPTYFDVSSATLIEKYSEQPALIPHPGFLEPLLDKFVAWDSVYLTKLSMEGIAFEHEWVFGPLFWRFFYYLMSTKNIYDIVIMSLLLNAICHWASCIVLYYLTLATFKAHMVSKERAHHWAQTCAFLCCIQPSGIFSTAPYTESITQLICYSGVLLRSLGRSRNSTPMYITSGILFSVAFGFRSNCLLYGILYLYDLYHYYPTRRAAMSIIAGSFLGMALIIWTYLPWRAYCPVRGAWCNTGSRSLVGYAQSHYWNVGFMRYFTLKNLPLLIIALPQLAIMALSLVYFRPYLDIRAEWIVTAVYLCVQLTVMHVQIVNRVSTFVPLHLWYIGAILNQSTSQSYVYSQRLGKLVVKWWIVWITIQTCLYASFLPPA